MGTIADLYVDNKK